MRFFIGFFALPVVTLALSSASLPAVADVGKGAIGNLVVELVSEAQGETPIYGFPGQEEGKWQRRVQLVWNKRAGTLERRAYEVWNPLPSLKLQFTWNPDDIAADKAGRITGKGELLWRKPGAASYDKAATRAIYRGEMNAGKAHGAGEFFDQSGHRYEGAWQNGLMHGDGRLQRPSGDEFQGAFQNGRPHGKGRYVDASGTIYEGQFFEGERNGEATISLPDGQVYKATFRLGQEIGQRTVISDVVNAQAQVQPGLRFGVVVNELSAEQVSEQGAINYTAFASGNGLIIQPKYRRILSVWKGAENIFLQKEDRNSFPTHYTNGFLGTDTQHYPVYFVLSFENGTANSVGIANAFIDVVASQADLQPALSATYDNSCNTNQTKVSLSNYGWSPAFQAKVDFTLLNKGSGAGVRLPEIQIGTINQTVQFDIAPQISANGYDARYWSDKALPCEGLKKNLCFQRLISNGYFGKLGTVVYTRNGYVYSRVAGALSYLWRDRLGQTRQHKAKMDFELQLGSIGAVEECGEGGDVLSLPNGSIVLPSERANYNIPLGFRGVVPAGVTGRWGLELSSTQSSLHMFTFLLQLTDGRFVRSRPITLQYFKNNRPKIN